MFIPTGHALEILEKAVMALSLYIKVLEKKSQGNESRSGGGFMGIALGVDCFYTNSLFLNVTGCVVQI